MFRRPNYPVLITSIKYRELIVASSTRNYFEAVLRKQLIVLKFLCGHCCVLPVAKFWEHFCGLCWGNYVLVSILWLGAVFLYIKTKWNKKKLFLFISVRFIKGYITKILTLKKLTLPGIKLNLKFGNSPFLTDFKESRFSMSLNVFLFLSFFTWSTCHFNN